MSLIRSSVNKSNLNTKIFCRTIRLTKLLLPRLHPSALKNSTRPRLERKVLQASYPDGLGRIISNCQKEICWKRNSAESEVHTGCSETLGRSFQGKLKHNLFMWPGAFHSWLWDIRDFKWSSDFWRELATVQKDINMVRLL